MEEILIEVGNECRWLGKGAGGFGCLGVNLPLEASSQIVGIVSTRVLVFVIVSGWMFLVSVEMKLKSTDEM